MSHLEVLFNLLQLTTIAAANEYKHHKNLILTQ